MDFLELEGIEGLRWSWNSWPTTKTEATSLVIPLSIMCSPLALMESSEVPVLEYEPLICLPCGAILNPYARIDYQSKIWHCPFCHHKNGFPKSYAGIGEHNLPAELFPTYSAVEYQCQYQYLSSANGVLSSSSSSSNLSTSAAAADSKTGPAFVFVVDLCTPEDELSALKKELLLVVSQLPENALLGLVTFDSMVRVHDLSFADCNKVVIFHGQRDLTSTQIQQFLQIQSLKQPYLGKTAVVQKQGFLVALSECEFIVTTAIEEICSSGMVACGHRPLRATGTAISVAVGLIEGCMMRTGSRVMVFTSGPATIGPGIVVESDCCFSIRNHRDLINGQAPFF